MKAETKARISMIGGKIWRTIKTYGPWIAGGFLAGGALRGYTNEREIRRIQATDADMATAITEDHIRIEELQRQPNLLFERALRETEGKGMTE